MQFYNPQVLYGLFALAIPIIIHLFQLRKFKSEPFTNVVLLKKLIVSSRKSSRLKKWLSLITRLLIILCLVFAFSQPYLPNADQKLQNKQISIFIDNSYSMSLNGENTGLFNQAKQELLEVLPNEEIYNLATHDESFKNLRVEDIKGLIYDLKFTTNPLDIKSVISKTESLFNTSKENTENELIVLSDFQSFEDIDSLNLKAGYNYNFVKYQAQEALNFSIDTAYLESSTISKDLIFEVSSSQAISQSLPVSISDGNTLIGKFSIDFEKEKRKSFTLSLEDDEILNGMIRIEDKGLDYDNKLHFSISKPKPIKVLVISEKVSPYLDRIFNNDRFDYQQVVLDQLEYEDINSSDFLILNELSKIPNALQIAVENFIEDSGSICIIPGKTPDLATYNLLFDKLNLSPFQNLKTNTLKLTGINFDHPIFKDVFTKNVENFDYPGFESYFESNNPEKALSFSNQLPLLESRGKLYRFNASIQENSNFLQSSLVVLSFFSMATQTQNKESLYVQSDDTFSLKLNNELTQDEVLSIVKGELSFIPKQTVNGKEVTLSFRNYPKEAGHYTIRSRDQDTLSILAFNANRKESKLNYLDLDIIDNVNTYKDFRQYTQRFNESYNIQSLWKWFIVLALIFMIIELLLLRYIK